MNPFEKKPIQAIHPIDHLNATTVKAEKWVKRHLALSIVALILGVFTMKGVMGAIQKGTPLSVKQIFIAAVGGGLETDGYGHTNILLLGIGGEGHSGAQLTDTMIVASLDEAHQSVSMISIPRDLYIESEAVGWGTRINSIYEYVFDKNESPIEAEAELQKEIENVLGLKIQYYAKIDFQGFTDIVDAIGGITVEVAQSINDDAYPAPDGSTYSYSPFYIAAGTQMLDGTTALKYVRSRHDSSDFDRAKRQQEVITAIKNKALSLGVLTNGSKIKDIATAISQNFETNLTITELLTLVSASSDFKDEDIQSAVISDAAYEMGGFLYTPERKEGDPYYLAPYAGDFSEIQKFAQFFFYHPEIYKNKIPIEVLNGTKANSLAGLTKMVLTRYGFNVVNYGNATSKDKVDTKIYQVDPSDDSTEETLNLLPSLTFGEIVEELPAEYQSATPGTAKIVIELGQDFWDFYKANEKLFYIGFY